MSKIKASLRLRLPVTDLTIENGKINFKVGSNLTPLSLEFDQIPGAARIAPADQVETLVFDIPITYDDSTVQ